MRKRVVNPEEMYQRPGFLLSTIEIFKAQLHRQGKQSLPELSESSGSSNLLVSFTQQ
jgi:hypothetical protein